MGITTKNISSTSQSQRFRAQLKGYGALLKFRLSTLVAISAVFGYALAAGGEGSFMHFLMIGIGGLMVTGASNAMNQLFEKDYDKLMTRTAERPLPTGVVSNKGAMVFAVILAIAGTAILGLYFNLPAALLGIIGLLSYAFVYTPMKRISSSAVFIGAIPGGLPPLIGWVAFTGSIGTGGLILFFFQFIWQFPHFWAIAWLLDEDYKRAGFKMLPSSSGKSRFSATLILIYTLSLIPMVLFPFFAGLVNVSGMIVLAVLGMGFVWPAFLLYRRLADEYAKRLMFASFLYLPLIQLTFLIF